jgi:succinate dehydrogenase / fumarate reductase flavoprotein subunit
MYNPGWNLVFELRNLLTVSRAVTLSALQRTESRGAHSRVDYPEQDDRNWGGINSVICRDADGRMMVARSGVPPMASELRGLLGAAH